MELVGNHTFTLTTSNDKRSRLRCLKNGVQVQQGFVLAPLLFSTYTSDLTNTISRTYAWTNDLATTHADGDWQTVERVLSKDMAIVGKYLQTWKLKLTTTKAVLAVFRLSSISTTRKLNVSWKSTTTKKPCSSGPSTYTSEWCCTGHSRTADTSSHFAKPWHHALHSSGVLLTLAMVLVQQHWEQPP